MKLVNPTDAHLNAAFDKVVTQSVECDQWRPFMHDSMLKGECGHEQCHPRQMPCNYCEHIQAVLPWLERSGVVTTQFVKADQHFAWRVDIWEGIHTAIQEPLGWANDKSLAKACVIALLRSRGVQIDFP